jgi:alpha-tubulin suppressor-like RCC1 family protein
MRRLPHLLVLLAAISLAGCEQLTAPSDNGNGARSQTTPAVVFGTQVWTSISAGYQHTCAIDNANAAWCWGANTYGQVGVATAAGNCPDVSTCAVRPLQVNGGHAFTKIDAGVTNTCALRADGKVYCWGGGFLPGGVGYLGNDSLTRRTTPTLVIADSLFTDISVGIDNVCALTASGQAWCWGENDWGEIGDGTITPRLKPVLVPGGATYSKISQGWSHTCGLLADATAQCWGLNIYGQVGVDTVYAVEANPVELSPRAVENSGLYTEISAGAEHTCARTTAGIIECWGRNEDGGQLASPDLTLRRTPGAIGDGRTYTMLESGAFSNCGIANTTTTYCWGFNVYGALGNGTRSVLPVTTPVAVLGGPWTTVSNGGFHTCAIDAAGKAYCWGDRKYGQIGK